MLRLLQQLSTVFKTLRYCCFAILSTDCLPPSFSQGVVWFVNARSLDRFYALVPDMHPHAVEVIQSINSFSVILGSLACLSAGSD